VLLFIISITIKSKF